MKKVIQFAFATLLWGVTLMFTPQLVVKIFGIAFIPAVCGVFAVLGTLLPKLFGMGVSNFAKANIVEKFVPVLVVAALCFSVSLMPQTYATAAVVSLFLGNTTSYLGYLIGTILKLK